MRILIFISILLLVSAAICYKYRKTFNQLLIETLVNEGVKSERQLQMQLLSDSNYLSLLEACREISKQAKSGEVKAGEYSFKEKSSPQVARFSKMLQGLTPSYLYIDENDSGRIVIVMAGGLSHFGVAAYTEDFKPPWPNYKYGDQILIPGLWYCDAGFEDNPDYRKEIELLIKKNKFLGNK